MSLHPAILAAFVARRSGGTPVTGLPPFMPDVTPAVVVGGTGPWSIPLEALATFTPPDTWTVLSVKHLQYYFLDAASGSDSNPGTEEAPFQTLAHAVTVLGPQTKLWVKNGTYTRWSDSALPAGASWDAPIEICAFPGHTPKIVANAGQHTVLFIGTQYVILRGFEIDGTGGISAIVIDWSSSAYQAHHIRIQDCDIHSFTDQGIAGSSTHASGPIRGCEIIGNRIHDGGSHVNLDHGIYFAGPDNIIEGNEIYNCFAFGIHIYNSSGTQYAFRNIVRSNYVHDNAVGGSGTGIFLGNGDDHLCYNNIVAGNDIGIRAKYGLDGSMIYNNTVYDNNIGGPNAGVVIDAVPNCIVRNNIIWGHSTPIEILGGVTATQENNVTTNPLFVDPTLILPEHFKLQALSPAVDAGLTLAEIPVDYDGVARPRGGGYDCGAFESAHTAFVQAPPSGWTEVGSGANIRIHGSELKIRLGDNISNYIHRPVAALAEVWVQFNLTVPTFFTGGHFEEGVFSIPVTTTPGTAILRFELRQATDGVIQFRFGTRDDAATSILSSLGGLGAARPITYLVDMHWRRATGAGANNGLAELYVNGAGSPSITHAAVDNDTHTAWDRLALGPGYSLRSHTTYDITIDNLKVGASRGASDILAENFGA